MRNFKRKIYFYRHNIFQLFICLMLTVILLFFKFGFISANNIEVYQKSIEENNEKITQIKQTKEQLHQTANCYRSKHIDNKNFLNELKKQWDDLNNEQIKLEKENSKLDSLIQKENKRKIHLGQFQLTAYCVGNITSTGTKPTANRTIAVDPKVIPYGSIVEIEGHGTYVAEDCGGVIKGNIIDIYIPNYNTCINFGRKVANVYIIKE